MKQVLLLALFGAAAPLAAQGASFSLGAHGDLGVPVGDGLVLADPGFGFGAEAVYQITSAFGVYAGYSIFSFGTDPGDFGFETGYDDRGFELGARLNLPVGGGKLGPWVAAGGTFRTVEVSAGEGAVRIKNKSDGALGFELGAGIDFALTEGGILLRPAARYRRYSAELETGVRDIAYLTIGLGVAFAFFPTYP